MVVLVETAALRWAAAGLTLDGQPLPLVRSEAGDLEPYLGLPFDEQVSFLRHRLSGVLQRAVNHLWARQKKPCQCVFVFESKLPHAAAELTERVADHFVQWMANPPVVAFLSEDGFSAQSAAKLTKLAGELDQPLAVPFAESVVQLFAKLSDADAWELIPKKPRS